MTKRSGLLSLLVVALLAASAVDAVVVGIDFGYEWVKVSMVKPGIPMEVVLNTESKRKTPQQFTFYDDEVLVGSPAEALSSRFPDRVLQETQMLLGQTWDSPMVQHYLSHHPSAPLVEDPERHVPLFKLDENTTVAVETISSMVFSYAKQIAEEFGDTAVRDCVVTVPVFFTQRERLAIKDAAELAGFNVLSLINDNTAVAVNYGVLRTIEETEEKPRRVLFYDMGAASTKASLMEFYSKQKRKKAVNHVEVKTVAFDRKLGGRDFEARLVDLLVDRFNALPNAPAGIRDSPRAMAKLRKYAGKVKLVLSANSETQASIESLYEDVDLQTMITRAEFEGLCEDLFARATEPVAAVLAESGFLPGDLDEFVLVGGGARIPRIQEELKAALGRDTLDKNINADEAAVLGAAFYGATLSTAFRVKEFSVSDVTAFPIGVTFQTAGGSGDGDDDDAGASGDGESEGDGDEATGDASESADEDTDSDSTDADGVRTKMTRLFKKYNKMPSKKSMTFARNDSFQFTVSYMDAEQLPSADSAVLGSYTVDGVADTLAKYSDRLVAEEAPKVRVAFSLTPSGTFEVRKAELVFNESVPVKVKKDESWLGGIKDLMGFNSGEEVTDDEADAAAAAGSDSTDDGADGASDSTDSAGETASDDTTTTTGEGAETAEAGSESTTGEGDDGDGSATDSETADPSAADDAEAAAGDDESSGSGADDAEDGGSAGSEGEDGTAESESEGEKKEGDDAAADGSSEGAEGTETEEKKFKIKSKRVELKFSEHRPLQMSESELKSARKTVQRMLDADYRKKQTAHARNDLESYVYETKEKLYDEAVEAVSNETQRDELRTALEEVTEWIEFDADEKDGPEQFQTRLEELKGIGNDMFYRAEEAKMRPMAVDVLRATLAVAKNSSERWHNETKVSLILEQEPRLKKADLDGLDKLINETEEWLDAAVANQSTVPAHVNPSLTTRDIKKRYDSLDFKLTYLGRKPQPKFKKPKVARAPTAPKLKPLPIDTEDVNDPPVFVTTALTAVTVEREYVREFAAVDVDNDTLSFSAGELPEWLSLVDHGNGSAVLSGTPDTAGRYNVSLSVFDDGGLNDTMDWVILVRNKTLFDTYKSKVEKEKKEKAEEDDLSKAEAEAEEGDEASGEESDGDSGDDSENADGDDGSSADDESSEGESHSTPNEEDHGDGPDDDSHEEL